MGAAAMSQLEYQNGSSVGFNPSKVSRKGRLARNQVLEYIDTREYKMGAGYEKQVVSYKENNFSYIKNTDRSLLKVELMLKTIT